MNQSNTKQTPKGFMKTFSIVHFGLAAGVLALGLVQFSIKDIVPTSEIDQEDPMIYIFPIVGLAGIFVGNLLFKQLLPKLKSETLLSKKLMGYQTANIIRWALIEGPPLLNIIWFGSTGNSLFLAVGGTLFVYLLWLRPAKQKTIQELELKGELLNQFKKESQSLV